MADVADVGAAAILWFFVRDPHGLEDLFRRFRRRFIPDHVIEFAAHLGDVICRFRSNGRPFEAVHDLGHNGIEIFPFAVADTTFDFGVIGNDVGGGPTVYDIRADARFRPDVLAQHIDGVQGQHGPIQGIAAVPGFTGGVSRLAVEGDAVVVEGQEMGIGIGPGRRHMDHDGEIIVLEDALVAHDDLAAAQFFVRCADEVDVDRQILQIL